MLIKVLDINGLISQEGVQLDVVSSGLSVSLVHEVVSSDISQKRTGVKYVKSRSDVSASGRKPWKQKHTGRARAGTVSSPIWRSGGVAGKLRSGTFGIDLPSKKRRKAFFGVLDLKVKSDSLFAIDSPDFQKEYSTKSALHLISNFGLFFKRLLLVVDDVNSVFVISLRNVSHIDVIPFYALNCYLMLKYDKILIFKNLLSNI